MNVLGPLIVIALMLAVAWFVGQPLRRPERAATIREEGVIADLRAARDAKYREIRDAEMDRRTGKLSDEDWRILDRQLRTEAIEVLHELDRLGAGEDDGVPAADPPDELPPATPAAAPAATIAPS